MFNEKSNTITFISVKVIPVSATQSGTYQGLGAHRGIDDDLTTATHSSCNRGQEWMKIVLPGVVCVEEVMVYNSIPESDWNSLRMDGTAIMVADSTKVRYI